MELDLSRLNNLAVVVIDENKQATKQSQKQREVKGEYKTIINPQKPSEGKIDGIDGIRDITEESKPK